MQAAVARGSPLLSRVVYVVTSAAEQLPPPTLAGFSWTSAKHISAPEDGIVFIAAKQRIAGCSKRQGVFGSGRSTLHHREHTPIDAGSKRNTQGLVKSATCMRAHQHEHISTDTAPKVMGRGDVQKH